MAGVLTKCFNRYFLSLKNRNGILSQLYSYNNTNSHHQHNRNGDNYKKYSNKYAIPVSLCFAGFLGYIVYEKDWISFPALNAAVPINGGGKGGVSGNVPLAGRREKFNFISDVVRVASPSVVYIEIVDPTRYDFFTKQPVSLSNGSGFIVQHDGLILTNAHVVVGTHGTVNVKLQNGSIYRGVVESYDMKADLATVRISVTGLPAMKLGNSADLQAGEWVVALGSPLSLNNTITAGVVSTTQRRSDELGMHNKDMSYIQTDAAITFGNSGGPLVNLDGEAIGINSMKVTSGISFAIPIDYAKEFLARRKEMPGDKKISKRYLGITMLSLSDQILHELKIRNPGFRQDITHGILVMKVIVNSPAYKGGLKPGDVVTHINDKKMYTSNDIYKALEEKTPVLKLHVIRIQENLVLKVVPEDPSI